MKKALKGVFFGHPAKKLIEGQSFLEKAYSSAENVVKAFTEWQHSPNSLLQDAFLKNRKLLKAEELPEPEFLKICTEIFSAETLAAFLRHPASKFATKELEAIRHLFFSRLSEFQIELHVKESTCSSEKGKNLLLLEALGQPLLSFELTAQPPELETDPDETLFCMEAHKGFDMASFNQLHCYDFLFKKDSSKEVVYPIIGKIFKVLLQNFLSLVEELALHLRTRITIEDLRVYLYQLELSEKAPNFALKTPTDETRSVALKLSKPTLNEEGKIDDSSTPKSLRQGEGFLLVQSDNHALRDKLHLKLGVKGTLEGEQPNSLLENWFGIDLEAGLAADSTILARLKAGSNTQDFQFRSFWAFEDPHSAGLSLKPHREQLRAAILSNFQHHSNLQIITNLKMKYLDDSFGGPLAAWLGRVYKPTDQQAKDQFALNGLLPESFKNFQSFALGNLATSAGLVASLFLTMKFLDEKLFSAINGLALPNQQMQAEELLREFKWPELQKIMTESIKDKSIIIEKNGEFDDQKQPEGPLAPIFSGNDKEQFISKMVSVFAAAETAGVLPEVVFLLNPSQEAETTRKIRVLMSVYPQTDFSLLHLFFQTTHGDSEFIFPLQSQDQNFLQVAEAVGEALNRESHREHLVLHQADKYQTFSFDLVSEAIEREILKVALNGQIFCLMKSKETQSNENGASKTCVLTNKEAEAPTGGEPVPGGEPVSGGAPVQTHAATKECVQANAKLDDVSVVFKDDKKRPDQKHGYLLEINNPSKGTKIPNNKPAHTSFAFGTQYEYNYLQVVQKNLGKALAGLSQQQTDSIGESIQKLKNGPQKKDSALPKVQVAEQVPNPDIQKPPGSPGDQQEQKMSERSLKIDFSLPHESQALRDSNIQTSENKERNNNKEEGQRSIGKPAQSFGTKKSEDLSRCP